VIRRSRKSAKWGIVSVGSSDPAIDEAIDRLARNGINLDYCRVRAFPFGSKLARFLEQHDRIFVVEQNRDAQLKTLIVLETDYPKQRLCSILRYGGLPMDCRCIVEAIEEAAARGEAA
jgi:2-oxoglutarate ferredoxin oxidoreductase subunit alpha